MEGGGPVSRQAVATKARPARSAVPPSWPRRSAHRCRRAGRGFGALADPVRLRVLSILAAAPEGEVCVGLRRALAKSQPTVRTI